MSSIFVSYRRDDSPGDIGRLIDDLRRRLNVKRIYRDIDSIPPRVDFSEHITRELETAQALIVIIGPTWNPLSATGTYRLSEVDDFVAMEIRVALRRRIPIFPIEVRGGKMPLRDQLPLALRDFARRNAFSLDDAHWAVDVQKLAEELGKLPGIKLKRMRAVRVLPLLPRLVGMTVAIIILFRFAVRIDLIHADRLDFLPWLLFLYYGGELIWFARRASMSSSN